MLRHRIRKYLDLPVHTLSDSLPIYFFPLWRADLKISGFADEIRRMCVDGSRFRKEKVADLNISGYVWTGPQSLNYMKNRTSTALSNVREFLKNKNLPEP